MRSARGSQARKDLPYRSCVGVMLINKNGLVFIGRRHTESDATSDGYAWQMSMVAGRAWRGRYRGQNQKWFAFRFEGDDSEINIHRPGGGGHRPEFDEWRWEEMHQLPELIIPFKRPVYATALAITWLAGNTSAKADTRQPG